MKINAFCTNDVETALLSCDRVVYCGNDVFNDDRVIEYTPFVEGVKSNRIYIDSMSDGDLFAAACDYLIENDDAMAIIRAAYDLTESGLIEAKYKLSPIMLLHKLGVLEKCIIVGGVCLDNDDLDLMSQCSVPLVITPTASAGKGYGFAPVCAAKRRGVRVGVGTFDGSYNKKHSLDSEIEFLRITANAEMRKENSLSESELEEIFYNK